MKLPSKKLFNLFKTKKAISILILAVFLLTIGFFLFVYQNNVNKSQDTAKKDIYRELQSGEQPDPKHPIYVFEDNLTRATNDEEKINLLFAIASQNSRLNDYDGAINALNRIKQINHSNFRVYEKLGEVYLLKKDQEKVDINFQLAIEYASNDKSVKIDTYKQYIESVKNPNTTQSAQGEGIPD